MLIVFVVLGKKIMLNYVIYNVSFLLCVQVKRVEF